jgi:hypothetical protein
MVFSIQAPVADFEDFILFLGKTAAAHVQWHKNCYIKTLEIQWRKEPVAIGGMDY